MPPAADLPFLDILFWTLALLPWLGLAVVLRRRRGRVTLAESSAASSDGGPTRLWLEALAAADDAVAFLEMPAGPSSVPRVNQAWRDLFSETVPDRLLQAVASGKKGKVQLDVERAELSIPEPDLPLGNGEIPPVRITVTTDGRHAVIVVPSTRAFDLALHSRQIAHNFNNALSAVVGGAGMVMDAVPEGSQAFQDLEQIEDAAMRAAELTSELQRVARQVAPPATRAPAEF